MATLLKLKIITPEKTVFEEMVDQVSLPALDGEITILANHIPLVTALAAGDIVAKRGEEIIPMAVVGGFVEIRNNEIAVLADFAEHVSEITDAAVEKAKARAVELREMQKNASDVDFESYAAELERSLTRVRIADKWRGKKYRI